MQAELIVKDLSAEEFCARVIPALSDREAENGLPFGIAQRLAVQPAAAQSALLLAVEAAGEVVAGAAWTPPHDIVVTRLPPGAAALVAERCTASGRKPTGASGPEGSGLELAELLARHTGSTVRVRLRQRVYELTRVEPVPQAVGAARRAEAADVALVAASRAENVLRACSPTPTTRRVTTSTN